MKPNTSPDGIHLLGDFYDVDQRTLTDSKYTMGALEVALRDAGFGVLKTAVHQFSDTNGFTGVVLLCESHAAIHTYPELGYAALDIFSCGATNPRTVIESLQEDILTGTAKINEVRRSLKRDSQLTSTR